MKLTPESFRMLPSAAFGDGRHPTTRLCATAVDYYCRRGGVKSFLDVGTGTGILARIARARGASFVVGTDIDPLALQAAHANAALDEAAAEINFICLAPDHWGSRFELVAANILEGPLLELSAALAEALAPHGTLLLSGFTPLQIGSLRARFESLGLVSRGEAREDGWALLIFQRGRISDQLLGTTTR